MRRHHVVPQMLLRGFADDRGRLVMVPREGGKPVPLTVGDAAVECGFYEIDVPDDLADTFDSEHVENLLSQVESQARPILDDMLAGRFPLDPKAKFDLALFLALQMTRGRVFREDFHEIGQAAAKRFASEIPFERVEAWHRSKGHSMDDQQLEEFWERVRRFEGTTVVASKTTEVMWMLKHVVETMHPHLFLRQWRLHRFVDPGLLISDDPVALWGRPTRDLDHQPLGVATADAIWMPLDRNHALGLIRSGEERIVEGTPIRMKQINTAVAGASHRWLFHHPDDSPLDDLTIPPAMRFEDEVVSVRTTRTELRELHRLAKKAVPPT